MAKKSEDIMDGSNALNKELLAKFKALKDTKDDILKFNKNYILKVISSIEYLETELENKKVYDLPEQQDYIFESYKTRFAIVKRALEKIADFDLYTEYGYIDEFVQSKAFEECRNIATNTIKELDLKVNKHK